MASIQNRPPPPPPPLRRSDDDEQEIEGNKSMSSSTIDSLPPKLLFKILLLSPAGFLHEEASLVCRRWSRVIRSDAFVSMHNRRSAYGLLLSSRSHSGHPPVYVSATSDGLVETSELSYKCINYISSCSGAGLAVEPHYVDDELSLLVVNPATKQSIILPPIPTRDRAAYPESCGIACCVELSMVHKVTLPYEATTLPRRYGLDIITVGVDKSWRHVPVPESLHCHVSSILSQPPLTTEGFMHWGKGVKCLTLDMKTETFRVCTVPLSKPHQDKDCRYLYCYYLSTGRYLTVLVHRGEGPWEVWEMKPESGRWRKTGKKIELGERCISWLPSKLLKPFGWVKYPEVLAFSTLVPSRCCLFYNLETHKSCKIPFLLSDCCSSNPWRAFAHKNTLVWLK